MKLLFYILSFIVSSSLLAQGNAKAALFVSNTEGNNNILVKWVYSEVYHPTGFDIYRSSGNSDWKKISSSPVVLNKKADVSSYDKETQQLYKAISQTSYNEFSTSIARAFVLMKAIYNNDFANDIGIYYVDKTTETGKKYKYKIVKHNETKETAISNEIVCEKLNVDFAPQEIVTNRKKEYITLSWKPDIYNYYGVDIYKKDIQGGQFEKITKIGPIAVDTRKQKNYKPTDVFFTDTNVNNDKGYIYKLVSLNYFGQESKFTEEIRVPIKDFVPPASPYSFKVRPYSVEQFARLTWEAIDEPDLNGFNIYSSPDPEGTFKKINTVLLDKNTRYFDAKNLPVGGHYFIVSAVDLAENETPTGMMFGEVRDIEPPLPPENLTSKAESGTINLSWKANSEGDLLGYIIQKSISDSNNLDNHYVQLNKEIIKENSFEIKLAKNVQSEFVYRILAVDTLYNISKPSINSMAQMPDVVPPQTPVISKIGMSTDDQNIVVTWIPNVDRDIKGYSLLRKNKGDSLFTKVNFNVIPADVTEYLDRSSQEGESYYYVVQAIDQSGNLSNYSNEFSFNLRKAKSTDSIEIVKSQYNLRKKEITIQWKWPGEEQPKGYVVYTMTNDGILKPYTGLIQESELKKKLTLESKKTFEVRAYLLTGEIIKSELFTIDGSKI